MKAFLYVTQTQPPKGNFNVTSINCSSSSRTLVFLLILLLPYSTHLRSKNPASDQNAISLMQAHITMLRYPTRRAPPFTETPISIQCSFFGQNYARTAHFLNLSLVVGIGFSSLKHHRSKSSNGKNAKNNRLHKKATMATKKATHTPDDNGWPSQQS